MRLITILCWISCFVSVLGTSSATAQEYQPGHTALTFQYVPNSDYETVVGVGLYGFRYRETGYYINGQFSARTISSRDDLYENLTVNSFGDPIVDYVSEFAAFNVGITRSFSQNFGVFMGVGHASVEGFAEMFDPMYILDTDGQYFVPEPGPDDSGFNANGGAMVQLGRLSLELGYHSFIKQGYAGIGFSF